MRKKELSDLLHSLDIPVNEGVTSESNVGEYPRIVYWPFLEEDINGSGEAYCNQVTYQISFYAKTPQHEKYRELRKKLRKLDIHPIFNHEYVEQDPVYSKTWHTYFSIDVLEEEE